MKTSVRLCHYLAQFSYSKYFEKICSENRKGILFPKTFPTYCLYEITWKCVTSSQFTDDVGQKIKLNSEIIFIY